MSQSCIFLSASCTPALIRAPGEGRPRRLLQMSDPRAISRGKARTPPTPRPSRVDHEPAKRYPAICVGPLALVVVASAVGLLYSGGVHSVPPFLWAGSRGELSPAGPFLYPTPIDLPDRSVPA